MEEMADGSFRELVSELIASIEEVASLYRNCETEREMGTELSILIEKIPPILNDVRETYEKTMDIKSIRKAVESLEKEINRAKCLIKSLNNMPRSKHMEEIAHGLGRSLGLVMFASLQVSAEFKAKIGELYKELMSSRFHENPITPTSTSTSSPLSESRGDFFRVEEIEEERVSIGNIGDVVLQLRFGNEEEFKLAVSGLNELIESKKMDKDWIDDEGIVTVLINRLSSSKVDNRSTIIQILRYLALDNAANKEKMMELGCLSALVKSLTRDVVERREAVGLLLDLSEIPTVRRRIGRIQGCIVMLVAMLNGHDDDPVASHVASKLLSALSSNTQNVLLMAEAGYFKPLVQYLKEGSDMSKILMATALSRTELTDQSGASLGKEGAVDHLVKMFNDGKLEAKLSALSALQNLSSLTENVQRLINSGVVGSLLQLLFSVTSVLMTLREPASAILARIAESESILVNKDVAQQMLSLLNLSSPVIQNHLLQALNSIAARPIASKVRRKMMENGAIQLLLPFLTETKTTIRSGALKLLYTLSKDLPEELTEQLGETNIHLIISIISSSTSENEKASASGILSNIPFSHKKAADILKKANLVPILVSIMNSTTSTLSTPTSYSLAESIAGLLVRFTNPFDKKLQLHSAEQGVIPLLVKLLSSESPVAKCRAATSLAQLSQNSLSLRKRRTSRWLCVSPSTDAFCEVHDGFCFVKTTFCLVKAGAIPPMIRILEGTDREADEDVLNALSTLLDDQIFENGSNYIAKMSGVQAIIRIIEIGNKKAQEKATWILERIFRIEEHRVQYGEAAQVVLIDLAQKSDSSLKSTIGKLLAQLELLQLQSSYF